MVKFKQGQKVKIIGNTANHNLNDGEIVTLTMRAGNGLWMTDRGVYVSSRDIKPVELTEPEIMAEIERLKNEADVLEKRLQWMKETKTTVFDDVEFKVWCTMRELGKKSSAIDKARAIARIIKGD